MGSLDRDHLNNNLIDQLDELRRRLDGLERSALRGTIGPYVPDETTTITGYIRLLIHEAGIPTNYRLAIADIYATAPADVAGVTPIGGIIAWSGSVNNVPAHWALCDGGSGTPDLRDRFILGAGPTYAVGATGGAATVKASHDHGVGSLDAAAEAAHTHADGTLAAAVGAHHHHNSTLAADSDSHSHGCGTLATGNDSHTHLVSGNTGTTNGGKTGGTEATSVTESHLHSVAITSGEYTHNHSVSSGSTASDAHTHDISGEVGAIQGASTGAVSGTTAAGSSHDHALSGSTATGGSATEANMPPYYVLAWIMRIS